MVDVHGTIIREVPFEPNHEGPIYTGRLQVLGAGFAPFKPYLRPRYFYFRVSYFQGQLHTKVNYDALVSRLGYMQYYLGDTELMEIFCR